jgi:predicted nucleic acid-binding protein
MSRYVVDASVAIKWLIPESHSRNALQLLNHDLRAPDLIWAELGNILWKLVRSGRIDMHAAEVACDGFNGLPLEVDDAKPLIAAALIYAQLLDRSVYDCTYVALAAYENCPLVTADKKLYSAVVASPLAPHILFVDAL